MKKILALLTFALFIIGCAGTPQEQSASKMMKMQQEKNELLDKGVVAGIGIGESKSEQLAYDEADLNARTDVARSLESKVEALIRNYQEEVGDELTQHKEAVKKNVISDMQNGVSVVKMDMEVTEAGKFKVYAIAALNTEAFKKAFEAALAAQKANVDRARAMKGYTDLDNAAAALDQYKANQK